MARGRMIDKKLITSRKVNSISLGAECLYVRVLSLTDDFGRYHSDTRILKAHAFSLRRVTERAIQKWLSELVDVGLIRLYSVDGEEYLEVTRFEDFQTFRTDRKRQELFPVPVKYHQCHTSDIPVGDCSLSEVSLREAKLSKENVVRSCDDPKCVNMNHWECQFVHFWKNFPKSIGRVDTHSLFLSICKKGEIEELIKGLSGYLEYLEDKRYHDNFEQAPMNSARFLRKENWKEYVGFKCKPKL